jgi:hypothetical protein
MNRAIEQGCCLNVLEAATGLEPVYKGFADLRLTTWLRRPFYFLKRSTTLCERAQMKRLYHSVIVFPSLHLRSFASVRFDTPLLT